MRKAAFVLFFFVTCAEAQTVSAKLLRKAIAGGNMTQVRSFVEKDPSCLGIRLKGNATLLYYAVSKNQIEISKYLIEKGADVNLRSKDKFYPAPLSVATRDRQYEITRLLVEKGAAINIDGAYGATPLRNSMALSHSSTRDDLEIFKYLVSKGADFKSICGECCDKNYLMYAIVNDKMEIAEHLVDLGIDLSQKDCSGFNALHYAVYYNKVDLVKLFLQKGINPGDKTEKGESAISIAKSKNFKEIVDLLTK